MPPRVLIVDDNSLIRKLLRRSLELEAGWQVCGEAVNGKEAIEQAQAVHPNFIVLDLSMPVMNGLEAARILNTLMPAVPVILFTSFITETLKEEALAAGVCVVLGKEDSMSNLIGAMRSLQAKDVA